MLLYPFTTSSFSRLLFSNVQQSGFSFIIHHKVYNHNPQSLTMANASLLDCQQANYIWLTEPL